MGHQERRIRPYESVGLGDVVGRPPDAKPSTSPLERVRQVGEGGEGLRLEQLPYHLRQQAAGGLRWPQVARVRAWSTRGWCGVALARSSRSHKLPPNYTKSPSSYNQLSTSDRVGVHAFLNGA